MTCSASPTITWRSLPASKGRALRFWCSAARGTDLHICCRVIQGRNDLRRVYVLLQCQPEAITLCPPYSAINNGSDITASCLRTPLETLYGTVRYPRSKRTPNPRLPRKTERGPDPSDPLRRVPVVCHSGTAERLQGSQSNALELDLFEGIPLGCCRRQGRVFLCIRSSPAHNQSPSASRGRTKAAS